VKATTRFFRRFHQPSSGQGVVEFALIFPILIALFFAILELGFYMTTNLTIQNAAREGARMASVLIDLEDNDPRVLTFVEDLIPDDGPFAGFVGGTSNTGMTDCNVTDQITVTVSGQYDFVVLNSLGLNGIEIEIPQTTHYELCEVFPVSETAVPEAPTELPTATGTISPSPTVTPNSTVSPTPSMTFTPSPTGATSTFTPSSTPTQSPIQPPVWVGGTYYPSGGNCNNLVFNWDSNNNWASNPGFGPTTYTRYVNGVSYGTQSANYPNTVTWNSGIDVSNGQTIVIQWVANFSGGLTSMPLWKSWRCSNGSMAPQSTPTPTFVPSVTLTPSVTRTPTPSSTPTSSHTPSHTPTASNTPTRTATWTNTATWTPSNTPTRTPTASNTPTRTSTPTNTATVGPPVAPVFISYSFTQSGWDCDNITLRWDANNAWATNPGYGPFEYERYRNCVFQGAQTANYPNTVTWSSTFDINHNQTATYEIYADFSGAPDSQTLTKQFQCRYGSIITIQ
jgi:Flp pilus assembly protein TadG